MRSEPPSVMEFHQVRKAFQGRVVLDGVDLSVRRGRVTFLVGASGAGKSLLMRHAVGLVRPDAGRVLVVGVDITELDEASLMSVRRRCGYVFQHATLLDGLTVVENVALPLRSHLGLRRGEALALARERLDRMGLGTHRDRYPAELSNGTRKQVAVCRSLALDPEVVILDEPTAGMDALAARQMDRLIRHLCDACGVTAVVVSHDLRSIVGVADHVAFLYRGRILAEGSVQDLRVRGDAVVQQFLEGRSTGPMEV